MEPSGAIPSMLRETSEWLVVNKPAGWHSVALRAPRDGVDAPPIIELWLRRTCTALSALPEAGLVHRLDLGTSGCLLVARTERSRAALREAMSRTERTIRKGYLAVVSPGVAEEGSFTLGFRSRHRRSARITVTERGEAWEQGRCAWRTIASDPTGDLIEVELIGPGRRHQIRAGFAHLGHPLAGDALYGGAPPLPGFEGAALHAWWLEIDGERVEAPPPAPWTQFQEAIRRRLPGSSSAAPTSAG